MKSLKLAFLIALCGCNTETVQHISNQELRGRFSAKPDFRLSEYVPPADSEVKVFLRTDFTDRAQLFIRFTDHLFVVNIPSQTQSQIDPNTWEISESQSGLKNWIVSIRRSPEKAGPVETQAWAEYTDRGPVRYFMVQTVDMKDRFTVKFRRDTNSTESAQMEVESKVYSSKISSKSISREEFVEIPHSQRVTVDLSR